MGFVQSGSCIYRVYGHYTLCVLPGTDYSFLTSLLCITPKLRPVLVPSPCLRVKVEVKPMVLNMPGKGSTAEPPTCLPLELSATDRECVCWGGLCADMSPNEARHAQCAPAASYTR